MKTLLYVLLCLTCLGARPVAAADDCAARLPALKPAARTLTAFSDDAQLKDWLSCQRDAMLKQQQLRQREWAKAQKNMAGEALPSPPTAAMAPMAAKAAQPAAAESVTNTQTAGVDEGGIVKVHGKHLVILRRGRLFTVDVSGREPRPIAALDAFAPHADPGGAWYDEMLIYRDTVVVIGYAYSRGGTEIGLFDIDAQGALSYRATYNLRSNDYYSARNYASRLIGSKLIFYTPLYLNFWQADPYAGFPAVRRWQPQASPSDFQPIAPATRIYRTDDVPEPNEGLALHTVTTCDLASPALHCEATAVMAPPGRVFYVSAQAVYVWTSAWHRSGNQNQVRSAVFRLPLDGSAPTALKTTGVPIDQFSFLEAADGSLNVLLRAEGQGDAMWASENGVGAYALLRAPVASFGNGSQSAPARLYHPLPGPAGYTVQNRFVGAYLLYGAGNGWGLGTEMPQPLYALRWADTTPVQTLALTHSIDRIEALGDDALVVGTRRQDLVFTSLALRSEARAAVEWVRPGASQGETRSHGFFYKPEDARGGLLGLPVARAGRAGGRQLSEGSAAVQFLRVRDLHLRDIGELAAGTLTATNDGCKASCVDWYGNARPLFLRGRVFALMGYELVEGRFDGDTLQEQNRINFSPRTIWGRGE